MKRINLLRALVPTLSIMVSLGLYWLVRLSNNDMVNHVLLFYLIVIAIFNIMFFVTIFKSKD